MPNYLLVGAVGGPNFGDEAILFSWIDQIRSRDEQATIYCDGYDLSTLHKLLGEKALTVPEDLSSWSVSYRYRLHNEEELFSQLKTLHSRDEIFEELIKLAEGYKKLGISRIHVIGGGYFNTLWPSNYLILILLRIVSWSIRADLYATGQGLTPIAERDQRLLSELARTFSLFDVRDKPSFEALLGGASDAISHSSDDILLRFAHGGRAPIQSIAHPSLTLCIQTDLYPGSWITTELLTDETLEHLKTLKITRIHFVQAMPSDISEPESELVVKLEHLGFTLHCTDPFDLARNGIPGHPDSIYITTRYHIHLIASLAGLTGIAIAAGRYYVTKHTEVKNLGSSWPVLDTSSLGQQLGEQLRSIAGKKRNGPSEYGRQKIHDKTVLAQSLYPDKNGHLELPLLDHLIHWTIQLRHKIKSRQHESEVSALNSLLKERMLEIAHHHQKINELNQKIDELTKFKQRTQRWVPYRLKEFLKSMFNRQ